MSDESFLPVTYSPLVRALDFLEERLFRLPVEMITKNPDQVDASLLDHLAWEHSVDVWDSEWPEDVKRNVITLSAEVHRYKGTPHSILTALSAFDVDTELIEWWQPEGQEDGLERGSFQVTAIAGRSLYGDTENAIDNRMVFAMNAVVQKAAPVSRKLFFRLGERFETSAHFIASTEAHRLHEGELDPVPRPVEIGAHLGVGAEVHAERIHAECLDPLPRVVPSSVDAFVRITVQQCLKSEEVARVQGRQ